MLLWINSYLQYRKQEVFVNGVLSDNKPLKPGVLLKDRFLVRFLFIIYINDIADELVGKKRLDADDTSPSFSSSDLEEIEITLNNDLKNLNEWAFRWLIGFNPEKTEVMSLMNMTNISFTMTSH